MSNTGKGLGRGLNALFPSAPQEGGKQGTANSMEIVPTESLRASPAQPRQEFNEESLQELANSIKARGILQPILARTDENGQLEIVAGERRWRAAKLAGLAEVPVIVRPYAKTDAMVAALLENIQRENLNALEEAQALSSIMELLSIGQTELATLLAKPRSVINNLLRLLRADEKTKEDLVQGRITQGHARCLIMIPEDRRDEMRERIIELGMSVRAAEMALSYFNDTGKFPWSSVTKERTRMISDPGLKRVARQLSAQLNCGAKIRGVSDCGKLELQYDSYAKLEEILGKLGMDLSELERETPPPAE